MANPPYYLHKLARNQGVTAEELVEAALIEGGNAHAAAVILGVSHDTIYHFVHSRGWTIEQCHRVIKPETNNAN